ncbi:alpha/beta hydrolase-fold protein [Vibrio porteresiae]|uniref:Alpha/beta hydrolase-fold protein n=1 Tax=Vibrio porteresiae DSM 19223 TaxID=1123496 RepID=A0ABZ0QLL2_9VIBR|nr:alpha/beta hydrolase-fold protein [Vibrio porteresiae]WPC76567.1 alpha/beta hydrolase-fold protein [Vibrio porteresiae DSM 19223]
MQQQLTITAPTTWAKIIDTPSYLRGSIRCDMDVQAIYITDSQGQTIRHLLKIKGNKAEIYWFADKPDHYLFHFVPQPNTPTTIEFDYHLLELKPDQRVSPQQEIISPLLTATSKGIAQHDVNAEAEFWQRVSELGSPLIEPTSAGESVVTFVYQGEDSTENVLLLGAPYDGRAYLTHLAHSQIWFKSYRLPNHSRFSYRLAVNVAQLAEDNWNEQYLACFSSVMVDPLNQQPQFGDPQSLFGCASTVSLPDAPNDAIVFKRDVPKGDITAFDYASARLGNSRKIHLYTPHNSYALTPSSPLLMLFDGSDYLTKVPTPTILDNLIAEGTIPPMRAVFIDTPSPDLRAQELTPNQAYADFLATEFKPWLCNQLGIAPSAQNTILSGSSYGGLASMFIAFSHPDHFGKVLCQSGSFWWAPPSNANTKTPSEHWFVDLVKEMPKHAIEIYMNAGLFEITPKAYEILNTNRTLVATLKHLGYQVTFEEVASGHDYFNWRVTLAHGLAALFKR